MSAANRTPAAWADLRATFEQARAAELAYDAAVYAAAIERADRQGEMAVFDERLTHESDRLADLRSAAEDALMACPSPDAVAFTFKYLIARGGGRDVAIWDAMLEDEAKRFAFPFFGTTAPAADPDDRGPDACLHQAWADFSRVKREDTDATVKPADRMVEVDHILFDRDAETVAGVALKLRAALYADAIAGSWMEAAALGAPPPDIDERMRHEDTIPVTLWSAIRSLEHLSEVAAIAEQRLQRRVDEL